MDDFVTKSQSDGLQLKESKCKEFHVDFLNVVDRSSAF